jgi:hypothetical protein
MKARFKNTYNNQTVKEGRSLVFAEIKIADLLFPCRSLLSACFSHFSALIQVGSLATMMSLKGRFVPSSQYVTVIPVPATTDAGT